MKMSVGSTGVGRSNRHELSRLVLERLANRVQLTSDGHRAYLEAVEGAFGGDVDYAMLVKMYGATSDAFKGRYSQPGRVHRCS